MMKKVPVLAILFLVFCSGLSLTDERSNTSGVIPVPASILLESVPKAPKHAGYDEDILPVHVGKLIPVLPGAQNHNRI